MSGNRQDFLRHLDESRRNVEQWPSWKQEALKASSRDSSASNPGSLQGRPQQKR